MFLCLADVFTSDIWQELSTYDDTPELAKLAAAVRETVIHSRADGTIRKYLGAFQHWKVWAHQQSLQVFPIKESHLVLYMQSLAELTRSKSAVEEACNAVAWVHAMANCHSPTKSHFVKTVLQGLQRNLAKPVTKKRPVTAEMLNIIVDNAEESGSLTDCWLATVCVVSYAAFLRFDELVNIKAVDITFYDDHMSINIPGSKTD